MLRRLGGTLIFALVMLTASAGPTAAETGGGASTGCVGQAALNNGCSSGTVTVTVAQDGGSSTTMLSAGGAAVCMFGALEVPCDTDEGWWEGGRGCYVSQADPQPPASDPLWQGHTDGTIYNCRSLIDSDADYLFWAATTPPSRAQVVQLAAQATSSLNLHAIGVGMAPTPTSVDPDSIGIVGLPNWMWVKDPSATTWGPASTTQSAGGLTVAVTAQAQTVTWDMGDGSAPIVCTGPGTPYSASYGKAPSPTCGYSGYTRQGTYPVSALTHWVVDYTSNVGIDGTLVLDLTSTASVTIGELQTTVG